MRYSLNFSLFVLSLALHACANGVSDASKSQEPAAVSAVPPASTVEQLTVSPLYSNAPDWNSYAQNDGPGPLSASNAICAGDPSNGYYSCIHGGEKRVTTIKGVTSCAGVSVRDALDAFVWKCDASANPVRIVSTHLQDNKNLSDLLDFVGLAWRSNVVTVSHDGVVIAASTAAAWWNNPIVEVPQTSASLAAPGVIYVVRPMSVSGAASFSIGADGVGLVVQPGTVLQGAGDIGAVITVEARKFAWVEGELNVLGDRNGLHFNRVVFSVARNVTASNANAASLASGIQADDADACYFFNLRASNNNSGIGLYASTGSYFRNIVLANNGGGINAGGEGGNVFENITSTNSGTGISFGDSDFDNVLIGIQASNNSLGIRFNWNSLSTVGINMTASNNLTWGIRQTRSDQMRLINTAVINNTDGIRLWDRASSNHFSNLVVTNNLKIGIDISDFSDRNTFTGLLKIGNNKSADCNVIQDDIYHPGLDVGASCNPGGGSTATLIKGPTVSADLSFVGKITTDDTKNRSDSYGVADYAEGLDWLRFDRQLRGWGKNGEVFPWVNNQGPCVVAEICRVWDWSTLATDTLLTGVLDVPNGSMTHTHTWSNASTTTFLANAVEIIGDGIGNENGLCESKETCVHTPNIGSYQGHGALVPISGFVNGTLSDITLLKYELNGR